MTNKNVTIITKEGNKMEVTQETRDMLKSVSCFHEAPREWNEDATLVFSGISSEEVLKFDPTAKINWVNPENKKTTREEVREKIANL